VTVSEHPDSTVHAKTDESAWTGVLAVALPFGALNALVLALGFRVRAGWPAMCKRKPATAHCIARRACSIRQTKSH